MRALAGSLLVVACTPAQVEVRKDPPTAEVQAAPDAEVRAVLGRFVKATASRDFKAALGLLSAPLRARYTPERLASDFDLEPLAKERLARIETALSLPITMSGGHATLPLAGTRVVKLVREDDGWHIAALE